MTGRLRSIVVGIAAVGIIPVTAQPVRPARTVVVEGRTLLTVQNGRVAIAYQRRTYPHWTDADHDCQDTRTEVLIAESLDPVVLDRRGCRVLGGRWHDPYTGREIIDPAQLDIDHLVPLRHANLHGGWQWDARTRRAYANDLQDVDHLVAVSRSVNRSKGARGPEAWRPPDPSSWCWYQAAWIRVKRRWHLTLSVEEMDALNAMAVSCGVS